MANHLKLDNFTSRVSGRGHRIGAVCVCVCLSVSTLTAEMNLPVSQSITKKDLWARELYNLGNAGGT